MRLRALPLAVALLVAFSPVLAELAGHMRAEAWARYALVFVPLLAWALAHEPAREPRRDGLVLVALAFALELFCLVGNTTRLARPAFPLALVGLCRAFGLARGRTALLACWLVPVPWVVLKLASPGLERLWLELAAALANACGAGLELHGSFARVGVESLRVGPADSGLRLVALLSGLGWYAALRSGAALRGCALRALVWGTFGLPAQALATLLAVAALALGHATAGALILDPGAWLVLALAGAVRAECVARRAAGSAEGG